VASAAVVPAQFALLGLALTAVTADHGTGGIVLSLQWTPRRSVFFTARTAVAVLSATALGVLLAAGSALVAVPASRGRLDLPAADGAQALGTVALVVASGAALAVGLGALLRSTAGALVGVFLLVLVLPLLLGNAGWTWATAVAEVLPGTGAVSLLVGDGSAGPARGAAVTVLLAWAGGALLLGWLRTGRDDVR
jgi:ABC-2 type transport system permease protein